MSVLEVAATVLVANAVTFGNGPVMVPILQARLVDEARVLGLEQLLYAFAIARVIPGQANAYVASIGYMLHGLPGALLSTAAIQLPGYAMLPLQRGHAHLRSSPAVRGFTRGLVAASIGLVFAATLSIARRTLTEPIAWAVFLVALGLGSGVKWHPVLVLAIASAGGIALRLAFG
jgi:chromate transporter